MSDELVHYDVSDGIATITLDSPHNRNALSRKLIADLQGHVERAVADRSVCAAVLTATGPVFCAGADLRERSEPAGTDTAGGYAGMPAILRAILESDLPFVARIGGAVRAGGTGLVAACDIAVAASDITFSFPEVHIGLVPAVITVPLVRKLDERALHRYLFTGELFDAAEAVRIGLITAAGEDVDTALAPVLAGLRRAHPAALRRTKQILHETPRLDVSAGLTFTAELSAHWFVTPDAQEGIRAVLEKRRPAWAR
jgi:enoyl-CoA hydratase/carnithine racemase